MSRILLDQLRELTCDGGGDYHMAIYTARDPGLPERLLPGSMVGAYAISKYGGFNRLEVYDCGDGASRVNPSGRYEAVRDQLGLMGQSISQNILTEVAVYLPRPHPIPDLDRGHSSDRAASATDQRAIFRELRTAPAVEAAAVQLWLSTIAQAIRTKAVTAHRAADGFRLAQADRLVARTAIFYEQFAGHPILKHGQPEEAVDWDQVCTGPYKRLLKLIFKQREADTKGKTRSRWSVDEYLDNNLLLLEGVNRDDLIVSYESHVKKLSRLRASPFGKTRG